MRIVDVLDFHATILIYEQILEQLPDLEKKDIEGSIKHARGKIAHPIVVV